MPSLSGEIEMVAKKSIGKLNAYYARLKADKADEIKPSHVDKVLAKLAAKKKSLETELAATNKESKKDRLKGKITIVQKQIDRGEWLKNNLH